MSSEFQNEFSINRFLVHGFEYAYNGINAGFSRVAAGIKSAVNAVKGFGNKVPGFVVPLTPLPTY